MILEKINGTLLKNFSFIYAQSLVIKFIENILNEKSDIVPVKMTTELVSSGEVHLITFNSGLKICLEQDQDDDGHYIPNLSVLYTTNPDDLSDIVIFKRYDIDINDFYEYFKFLLLNKSSILSDKQVYIDLDDLKYLYFLLIDLKNKKGGLENNNLDISSLFKIMDTLRRSGEYKLIEHLCSNVVLEKSDMIGRDDWYKIEKSLLSANKREYDIFLTNLFRNQGVLPKNEDYIIYIDLNNLGGINSEFGDILANHKLEIFMDYVSSRISPETSFIRKGGDEFLIFCPKEEHSKTLDILSSKELFKILNENSFYLFDKNYEEYYSELLSLFKKQGIDCGSNNYSSDQRVKIGLSNLGATGRDNKIFFNRNDPNFKTLNDIITNIPVNIIDQSIDTIFSYEVLVQDRIVRLKDVSKQDILPLLTPSFISNQFIFEDNSDYANNITSHIKSLDENIKWIKILYRLVFGQYIKDYSIGYHINISLENRVEGLRTFLKNNMNNLSISKTLETLKNQKNIGFLEYFISDSNNYVFDTSTL